MSRAKRPELLLRKSTQRALISRYMKLASTLELPVIDAAKIAGASERALWDWRNGTSRMRVTSATNVIRATAILKKRLREKKARDAWRARHSSR